MEMIVEHVGDVSLVVLKETTLDAGNYNEFKATIAPILEANAKVVLDINNLKFVDSSGLGAILSCLRKINASGGDLKLLCGLPRPVRMFFELVRIYGIIDILNTREEALQAFGASSARKP